MKHLYFELRPEDYNLDEWSMPKSVFNKIKSLGWLKNNHMNFNFLSYENIKDIKYCRLQSNSEIFMFKFSYE